MFHLTIMYKSLKRSGCELSKRQKRRIFARAINKSVCPYDKNMSDPFKNTKIVKHNVDKITLNLDNGVEKILSEPSTNYQCSNETIEDGDIKNSLEKEICINGSQRPTIFSEDLRAWAINNFINHNHLNQLLVILRKHCKNFNLPSDSRTLLETPRDAGTKIIEVKPGNYYHFGLKSGCIRSIKKYFGEKTCPSTIKCQVNIDGLPLTKSSSNQLWPIMASIDTNFYTEPFVIAIYEGNKKPENVSNFLKSFVEEIQEIRSGNIMLFGKCITIEISNFVCDIPAKSYITGMIHYIKMYLNYLSIIFIS